MSCVSTYFCSSWIEQFSHAITNVLKCRISHAVVSWPNNKSCVLFLAADYVWSGTYLILHLFSKALHYPSATVVSEGVTHETICLFSDVVVLRDLISAASRIKCKTQRGILFPWLKHTLVSIFWNRKWLQCKSGKWKKMFKVQWALRSESVYWKSMLASRARSSWLIPALMHDQAHCPADKWLLLHKTCGFDICTVTAPGLVYSKQTITICEYPPTRLTGGDAEAVFIF